LLDFTSNWKSEEEEEGARREKRKTKKEESKRGLKDLSRYIVLSDFFLFAQ